VTPTSTQTVNGAQMYAMNQQGRQLEAYTEQGLAKLNKRSNNVPQQSSAGTAGDFGAMLGATRTWN
jgi:hypothetical protein